MPRDDTVTVRTCEPEDEAAVLALLQAAFGRWPRRASGVPVEEFFRWKHRESPFGRSDLLLAEADRAVAGFVALMPWRLRIGAEVHMTVRGVDIAVHPAAQRRGVAARMIAAVRERYSSDIALGWSNPNQLSRGGVLRSGRRRVDVIPRFVGIGALAPRSLRRAALNEAVEPAPGEGGAHEAAAVLADDSTLRDVLDRAGAGPRWIETARSPDFLRWRYGRPGAYQALVAEDRDRRALAIFRTRRRGRLRMAHILELLAAPGEAKLARSLIRGVRRASGAEVLVCAFPSPRAAARCGFVHAPGAMVIAANPLRENLRPDPTQPGSWALSLGDLELI
jgi:GNAT superfamily N-acetyltransferase